MRDTALWVLVAAFVAVGAMITGNTLLAQPGRAPIEIGWDPAGNLVVTIPAGSPPFQLGPSQGLTVTVPGQPATAVPGDGLGISFPQGGTVTIPSCRKTIRVSGTGVAVAKRPAGPIR